jgi:tRNA(fMet)-specific endonuclease VapC
VSLKYLLDTNIVSEPLRPKPVSAVMRKLRKYEDEIAIASLVWHELQYGLARLPASRRRDRIASYLEDVVLATMPILDYDRQAAQWHAAERARLAARGGTPPFVDGQIAAIARVNELTLVTFNGSDFRRFEGLRTTSWR